MSRGGGGRGVRSGDRVVATRRGGEAGGDAAKKTLPRNLPALGSERGDDFEPAAVTGADGSGGKTGLDGRAGGGAERGAESGVGEEAAHVLGGVRGIGVGPRGAFGVGAVVAVECDEGSADGAAVGHVDEFGGRGPVGRDNGFAEIPFGSLQEIECSRRAEATGRAFSV